jgi:hypothetical protein
MRLAMAWDRENAQIDSHLDVRLISFKGFIGPKSQRCPFFE